MMKTGFLFLLMLLMGKGCGSDAQKDMSNTVVDYTANARGFYQRIVVKNQHYSVYKNRRDEQEAAVKDQLLSDADWKALVEEFQKLKLQELSTYEAPTKKRLYDGAPHADLKITYHDSVYQSQTFDHGAPPIQIQKLVEKINQLAPKS